MKNLLKYKNILITTYKNPDMDGLACMLAYENYLRRQEINCQAIGFGKIQTEPKYILKKYKINPPSMNIKEIDPFDAIIFLDANKKMEFKELNLDSRKVIQVIDHHQDPDHDCFPNAKIIDEPLGSLATRFVEIFKKNKLTINQNVAIMLYAAILSNTSNLLNNTTNQRDIDAIKYLEKIVKFSKEKFVREMYKIKSDMTGFKLEKAIDDDYKKREIAGKKFLIGQLEITNTNNIIKNRLFELKKILTKHKNKYGFDEAFICLSDPEKVKTTIVAFDNNIKKILAGLFYKKFEGDYFEFENIISRKTIITKLNEYLEEK